MLLQIDKYQYNALENNEIIAIKCNNCGKNFHKKKIQVEKAIIKNNHNKFNFCSISCAIEGFAWDIINLFTNREKCVLRSLFNNKITNSKLIKKRFSLLIIKELYKRMPDIIAIQSDDKINGIYFDIYIPSLKLGFIFKKLHNKDIISKEGVLKKIDMCNHNNIKLYVFDINEIGEYNNSRAIDYATEIMKKILYEINHPN
jgi:hypothetical protein